MGFGLVVWGCRMNEEYNEATDDTIELAEQQADKNLYESARLNLDFSMAYSLASIAKSLTWIAEHPNSFGKDR